MMMSSMGASGSAPEMSVHEAPPLVDSKTWPTPAFAIQRRENPPNAAKMWLELAGSMAMALTKRFGRSVIGSAVAVPFTTFTIPRWNPLELSGAAVSLGLHAPHQPA